MYYVFADYTSDLRVTSLAKHFGGLVNANLPGQFAIPQNRISAFNAAAFSAGLYLKHTSPTGIYHYSSKGEL